MSLVTDYKLIVNQKVGLLDFFKIFSDEAECLELYFNLKFSEHSCPKCRRNVIENYVRILRKDKNGVPKKAFQCRSCGTYIYPLSDTIFRKTTVPLKSIFFTIFMTCITKGSIGTGNIAERIGISYPTAHRLMMLIRYVMGETGRKMNGTVEIDEAFIGSGGSKRYNWSGISTRKQPIIGMVERQTGYVKVFLVENRNSSTINKLIRENVEYGSTVYTDSWRGYNELCKWYTHETVDHKAWEFVRGDVSTNRIENFWGQFKRNIKKAHIKIDAKYVQLYVNEACWRHNSIGKLPMQLFNEILIKTFFRSSGAHSKKKIKSVRMRKMSIVDTPS